MKCPECKAEIEHLVFKKVSIFKGKFNCSNCDVLLANTLKRAEELLGAEK